MEPNTRTIRSIIQLKTKFTQRYVTIYLSGLLFRYDSLNVTKTQVAAIIRVEKQIDMQNN